MRILINAISIREGGSRVVFHKLLEQFISIRPEHQWLIATNPVLAASIEQHPAIQVLSSDHPGQSAPHVLYWYEVTLPALLKQHRVDLLFSQTNYLPARKLCCPSLLLVQHAGHFSREFDRLVRAQSANPLKYALWRAKGHWVRRSIERASHVTVQTHCLAEEIVRQTGVDRARITVIPHGSGLVTMGTGRRYPSRQIWRIGCVTKIGVQKNFDTVFRAIAALAQRHSVNLVMSLDESTLGYPGVRASLEAAGIAGQVINHGEVDMDGIARIYDGLDLFVFPSTCESFGFPLIEAMARGLPVVAADIPSTRELAGDAVLRFAPADADQLAGKLEQLMQNPAQYEDVSRRGAERAGKYRWQEAGVKILE
ncbi:MAG: glycosyltransferase family 1 protein, partial [Xanthomonadales bacterium]|nr:glycosyltransferase family 1 protein [Xanthomonadales bacterium]